MRPTMLVILAVSTCFASSYTFLMEGVPVETPSLGFTFMHPLMDPDWTGVTSASGTFELRGTLGIARSLDLQLAIPYLVMEREDSDNSASAVGNLTLKLGTSRRFWEEHGWTGHFSVCLPTMSRNSDTQWAAFIGSVTNHYRGMGRYTQGALTIEAMYSSMNRLNMTNILLGFEIGTAVRIPTGEDPIPGDTELLVDYGFAGAVESGRMSFSLELVGLGTVTEGSESFFERFSHAAVFGWRWLGGTVRPGICLQINTGNNVDGFVDGVVGLDVELDL